MRGGSLFQTRLFFQEFHWQSCIYDHYLITCYLLTYFLYIIRLDCICSCLCRLNCNRVLYFASAYLGQVSLEQEVINHSGINEKNDHNYVILYLVVINIYRIGTGEAVHFVQNAASVTYSQSQVKHPQVQFVSASGDGAMK